MTIREKFNSLVLEEFGGMQEPTLTECEKIADDYAIEFAEWLRYNCVETDYGWQNHGKYYSDTEILKLFKKEKGL